MITKRLRPTMAIILLLIFSVACGGGQEVPPATPAAETAPTTEAAASPEGTTEAAPETTPATDMETDGSSAQAAEPLTDLTPTIMATVQPAITGTVQVNLNARQGPGTSYLVLDTLSPGTNVNIIGQTRDAAWLHIRLDSGSMAWITGNPQYVELSDNQLDEVAVVSAPPIPEKQYTNPIVDELLNQIPLVVHHGGRFTCASHAGLNNLLPEVQAGNVIGPHAGDFVYVPDSKNVLFEYIGDTFRLIYEDSAARFPGGAKSLSLDEALALFDEGQITWTGDFGQWPARGVTSCDPTIR